MSWAANVCYRNAEIAISWNKARICCRVSSVALNLLVSDVPICLSQGMSCDISFELYMRDCLLFTDDAEYKAAMLSVATTCNSLICNDHAGLPRSPVCNRETMIASLHYDGYGVKLCCYLVVWCKA